MAVCIQLARAGFRVLCVELGHNDDPVGESLDWSAPELLRELGFPMESLIAESTATYKRHVILQLEDGREREYVPGAWLADAPWRVELRTLHVDRSALHGALRELARREGVELLTDAAMRVEHDAQRRVQAVLTEGGRRLASQWFVDASGGSARLFPRAFQLPAIEYGPAKVAMWSYFEVPASIEGTTLYGAVAGPYMEWVWRIPIERNRISVGYVALGEHVKQLRGGGESVAEIYSDRLRRFPALRQLPESEPARQPRVVSFRCRVHRRLTGPNWIVIGEAATMIDPMTSNGVTAALRQAREAAELLRRARGRRRLPRLAAAAYSWRMTALAQFFNCGIERMMYDGTVRRRVGALKAGDIYTVPAWLMNLCYARLAPRGMASTALLCGALTSLRAAATAFQWWCGRGSATAAEESAA